MEIGKKTPSIGMLYRIADYLSITPAAFLMDELENDSLEILKIFYNLENKHAKFLLAITKAFCELLEKEKEQK